MENRKVSQWVDSISSVIRKTEMNLTMISRRPAYNTSYISPGPVSEKSSEDLQGREVTDSGFNEVQRELRAVKSALEKTVSDAAVAHKQDVESLMTRVAEAELKQRHSSVHFEGLIEQKATELQGKFKDFALKSDVQSAESALKQVHLQDQAALERKVEKVLADLESASSLAKKDIETRVQELSGQVVRQQQLDTLKADLMQTIDQQMKRIEDNLTSQLAAIQADLLAHSQTKLEAIRSNLRALMQNELNQAQTEVEELTKTVEDLRLQLSQQQQNNEAKIAALTNSAEELGTDYERSQVELKRLKGTVDSLPQDESEQYFNMLTAKLGELERRVKDSSNPNESDALERLEERLFQLEANMSQFSGVSDNPDIDISAGEALPIEEKPSQVSQGLATFGKAQDQKSVSPQGSAELMTITINDMGESDEADSADYVSPHISPMNKWVTQHTSMLQKAEEVRAAQEAQATHFAFDELKVPVAITEVSHEEEVETVEPVKQQDKVGRLVESFLQKEVEEALDLIAADEDQSSEAAFSIEEIDLP